MKRILVGIDDSPRTADVVATARSLAEQSGGKLTLAYAIGLPVGVPTEYYVYAPDQMPEVLMRDARRVLERWKKELPEAIVEGVRPRIGTAWNTLCNLAKEERADLIVIGSHGFGGLDHLLGTTAAKVVNHADCSVLVVRPPRSS